MERSTSFAPLAPGTTFARDFEIVRPLSQGGMGAVYVAKQRSTGRERALKLMHPRLVQDERQRRRFEQEARVGAGIESAHVVEIVGAGVDDETGSPWLCMELLKGRDLGAEAAERGALPADEVLLIFRQLCHAVGAAHRVGVVHRDLKPENVFLASSRQADVPFVVKVLDFGIAKMVADGQKTDTAAVGTPLWMSPEQTVAGASIGPPTDVWALGLIAFRLLSGRPYWKGASDETASAVTLLREIAIEPLAPASERARALGAKPLPAGFDAWFQRCVVREPEARWPDATAALGALAPVLGGEAAASWREGVAKGGDRARSSVPTSSERISGLEATVPISGDADTRVAADVAPAPRGAPAGVAPDKDDVEATAPSAVAPSLAVPGAKDGGKIFWLAAAGAVLAAFAIYFFKIRPDDAAEARARAAEDARIRAENQAKIDAEQKVKLAEARAELDAQLGKMVRVPASSFEMGSDEHDNDEKPKTRVSVAAFEIDQREVSLLAYAACLKLGSCTPTGTGGACNGGRADRATHPVNCVDHAQAEAFCKWAGKRLPREEEWELAARGTDGRLYPWGPTAPADEPCWKRGDAGTCVVGDKSSTSPFGLVDVAGNVREWTSSPFCPYTRRDCDATSRVARGGSHAETDGEALRASARTRLPPETKSADLGFRCARDALY
jgi:formylglycine-generating enzyme required for sulfatase activity/serine/threonine protein kinase